MRSKRALSCFMVLIGCAAASGQANNSKDITQAEIEQVINEYSDCDSLDKIEIGHLEYFDLIGDK